jgi:type III secretion protein V
MMIDEPPEVPLWIEIAPSLSETLDVANPLTEAIRRDISRRVADLLVALGIPGTPAVQIRDLKANSIRSGEVLRVYVNGMLCRYPDELLRLVYGYVNGNYPDPGLDLPKILAGLSEIPPDRSGAADADFQRKVEFLGLACANIIKMQPAALLGPEQVAAYIAILPSPPDKPDWQSLPFFQDPNILRSILGEALNMKISIADHRAVTETLGQAHGRSTEDIIEDLIVALRPEQIEIQLPSEDLRRMTRDHVKDGPAMFPFLRDGLFEELGLNYPKFRFAVTEELKQGHFAFKINHLTTMPLIGLRPDQLLANDTPDRLSMQGIDGEATINPATGHPASVINSDKKDLAEALGLTTWDQIGYLILSLAEALRKNSACFAHREAIQAQLNQLKLEFPALVSAVVDRFSIEQLTRILRALVAEEISIRNLRLILERLLEYDYGFSDSYRYLVLDDRPTAYGQLNAARRDDLDSLVSFLRAGMKRQIGNKYARGSQTLVVYLLDQWFEQSVLGNQSPQAGEDRQTPPEDDLIDNILEAIRQEIAFLPLTAQRPSILTSIAVRPYLRRLIAAEFPRIPVVAYQEVAPDLNIQPVARISLNA